VKGVEQEEGMLWVRCIMILDDLQRMVLKDLLLIAMRCTFLTVLAGVCQAWSFVWSSVGAVLHHQIMKGVEASCDFTGCLNSGFLVPHIIGVLVIHEARIKSTTIRCVLWSCHTSIPFSGVVSPVATSSNLLPHASHVSRNASIATHRIFWIGGCDSHILHQDTRSQTARDEGRACRATDSVRIVAF